MAIASSDALVLSYQNANLGKAPDAATKLAIEAYYQQYVTGGISESAAVSSTLKLVNTTTAVAIESYQFFTGRAPSAAGLAYLVNSTTNTSDLNDAAYTKFSQENRFINFAINLATGAGEGATSFKASYPAEVSYAQTVDTAYDKIIGKSVAAAKGIVVADALATFTRADNITYLTNFVKGLGITAAADIDLAVKAALVGQILSAAATAGIGGYATATAAMISDLSDGTLSTDAAAGVNIFTAYPTTPVSGKTFVLTTGADSGSSFVGTTDNDTFTAAESASNTVVTVGDTLDGGAGADTLNITQTAAFAAPVGLKVSNIETVNLITGTTGTVIDTTTSAWSGVTALNVTGTAAQTVTAGTGTAVSVTRSDAAATTLSVTGGSNVSVTETGANGGNTTLSGASGVVQVTSSILATAGSTGNTIAVTGGSAVTVTQKGTNAVNTTVTDGAVTVTGSSATKTVTVTNDKAATAGSSTVGHVNANVTINDVNRASTSAAGTIDTVTVANFATLAVNSGALKTVNLSGTGTTLNLGTLGALSTPANSALTINSTGLTVSGTTSIDSDITSLTLNGSTSSSTYTGAFTAAGVTALNVTGDAKVTVTAQTLAALTTVTSTNTAGVTLGSALGTGVTFTGGTGADTITLSNAFTKAITMGDGNDTVTYAGAAGTGGSVAAGNGTDIIKMTATQADAADADSTFNTTFTGFEILDVATGAAATTINLAGINGVNQVVTRGAAGALQLDGFTSGGTLTLDAAVGAGSYVANVTNANLTANDTFNLTLSNSTNGVVTFGTVALAGIETVNINLVDAGSGSDAAATIDTVTITDAAATSIKVSGNNGLSMINSTATAVTSFDASGVVSNSSGDTAANLAVTYTSANSTTSATVTIVGGAGNDVLTGNAAKDTITGGAGADILSGAAGQDTLNVGNGHDIIKIASSSDVSTSGISESTTAAADIVNGFTLASAISTATDLSTQALYQASTAGGANATLLNLDLTQDGVGAGVDLAVAIEANATGTGQAAGVTYTVTGGILTLSGSGASTVDTLGEWLTEAAAVSATNGETIAFQFGSDTYVFSQNGTSDVLVQLVGVTGATGLVLASAATTASAGSILIGDSLA